MKHLSRNVVPGSYRLATPDDNSDVLAFVTPDGHTVVLLANTGNSPRHIALHIAGKYLNLQLPAHSFHSLLI